MSTNLEKQIATTFERAAGNMQPVDFHRLEHKARLAGLRRRRRQTVLRASASGLIVVGIAGALVVQPWRNSDRDGLRVSTDSSTDSSSATASASPSTSTPTPTDTVPAPTIETQRCADLDPPPGNTELDTVLMREEGILQVWFTNPSGKNVHFAIRYSADPSCQRIPAFRRLIEHVVSSP